MAQGRTIKAVTVNYHGSRITLPVDTRVISVMGGLGPSWAVANAGLVMELTGNTHDPKYRYCWVPDDAVKADG